MSATDRYDALPALPLYGDLDLAPSVDEPRRHIEIVTTPAQKRARPKYIYALVSVLVLGAALMGQLLLTIAISEGAYEVSALRTEAREAVNTRQSLAGQEAIASSPQQLAKKATELGMVLNPGSAYLTLKNPTVLGAAVAAPAVTKDTAFPVNIPQSTATEEKQQSVASTTKSTAAKKAAAEKATEKKKTGNSAAASAPAATVEQGPVAWDGDELPVPQTH